VKRLPSDESPFRLASPLPMITTTQANLLSAAVSPLDFPVYFPGLRTTPLPFPLFFPPTRVRRDVNSLFHETVFAPNSIFVSNGPAPERPAILTHDLSFHNVAVSPPDS